MGVSAIDGVIEQVETGRQYKKVTKFKSIVFREDDGGTRTMKNLVALNEIAGHITPGASGRFYTVSALDVKGIHGVRKTDGTAAQGFPAQNNIVIFGILAVVGLASVVLRVSTSGGLPLLGVAMIILGVVGWVISRKASREAAAQFEADAGGIVPAAGAGPVI